MGTLRTSSLLGSLLLGKTRLSILSLLFSQPERRLYLRQIIRLAGAGQGAVQRELARLVRAGVLTRTREGNLAYYQVNRAVPVFEELRGIVQKTAGIADLLRVAVSPLQETLGREINPTVFTADEFEKRLAARDHFLSQVMQDEQVDVIGGKRKS